MASTNPSTRRRWFQFRISTLLVVITVLAAWLGWELDFVRKRQSFLREHPVMIELASTLPTAPPPPRIGWLRMRFGDEPVPAIAFPDDWPDEQCEQVVRLFAEAKPFRAVDTGQARYPATGQPYSLVVLHLVPYQAGVRSVALPPADKPPQFGPQPAAIGTSAAEAGGVRP